MKLALMILALASPAFAQVTGTANLTATLNGQTASVAISILPPTQLSLGWSAGAANLVAGQSTSFDIALTSTCSTMRPTCQQPAAFQFDAQALATDVSGFTVTEGPAATTAAKTWTCAPQTVTGQTAIRCLLVGVNQNKIANGVVAHVSVKSAPGATGTAPITTSGFIASNITGAAMQGAIAGGPALTFLPTLGLACAQTYTEPGEAVSCTVSLSAPAASSTSVTLASDHPTAPGLVAPASVTVAQGSATQAFTITGQ